MTAETDFESQLHQLFNSAFACEGKPIEVLAQRKKLEELFVRIKQQWSRLGESEPFWSVLVADRFKRANIQQNLEEFRSSGRYDSQLIQRFAQKNNIDVPAGVCLELGCGVGRSTRYLADVFRRVLAVDISPGNLAECKKYMAEEKISNVETFLLADPRDIKKLPRANVFFSQLVLQHNPPPLQHYLLDEILKKMNRNGLAVFQTSTHKVGYSFVIDDYLKSPEKTMEMHCLPMSYIMQLFEKNHFSVIEVARDNCTGSQHHSYTFFAQKRR